MGPQLGGCLCGALRYAVNSPTLGVAVCTCHFCQKLTGSDYMVEPLFDAADFQLCAGTPATYAHRSEGSGKQVTVHFCRDCGTTLYHRFERFPEQVGVFAGTFDDPAWFERSSENVDYMFMETARRGTLVPAGYRTYTGHCRTSDGAPVEPTYFTSHHLFE